MSIDSIYVRLLKYCNGKECPDCIFEQYADTKNKHCRDLCESEIREVFDIIDGNKTEDKTMERNEVIKSIEETEKKLAELKEKLKNYDEVPDILDFKDGREYYYVSVFGDIKANKFYRNDDSDMKLANHHNIFESKCYAEEYAAKMKFLGEMMHFKWLYDRDFNPDNNVPFNKWTIKLDEDHKFTITGNCNVQPGDIYFSSEKIAKRCAEWLNKKYGYTKE